MSKDWQDYEMEETTKNQLEQFTAVYQEINDAFPNLTYMWERHEYEQFQWKDDEVEILRTGWSTSNERYKLQFVLQRKKNAVRDFQTNYNYHRIIRIKRDNAERVTLQDLRENNFLVKIAEGEQSRRPSIVRIRPSLGYNEKYTTTSGDSIKRVTEGKVSIVYFNSTNVKKLFGLLGNLQYGQCLVAWSGNGKIHETIEAMRQWEFEMIATTYWLRLNREGYPQYGQGRHLQKTTKLLIWATRNDTKLPWKPPKAIISSPTGPNQHPTEIYHIIESMYPIFAPEVNHVEFQEEQNWRRMWLSLTAEK